MPIDYSRPAPAQVTTSIVRHVGLLILRITAGGSLIFFHAGREAAAGWMHIWHKIPWDLPGQLAILGFPFVVPVAVVLVILVLVGATFIFAGLLTRLSAIVLAAFSGITALLFIEYPEIQEIALLYSGLCTAIALCGAGPFALDRVLKATAGQKV